MKLILTFGLFSLFSLGAYIIYLNANRTYFDPALLITSILTVPLSIIAGLLCYRRADNRISWIFVIVALMLQTNYLSAPLSITIRKGLEPTLGQLVLGNLWSWLSGLTFTLLAYIFVLFPAGRLPNRRWRVANLLLGLQIFIVASRGLFLTYDLYLAFSLASQGMAEINLAPLAETGPSNEIIHTRAIPGIILASYGIAFIALVMVLLGLSALFKRYRDGNHTERQQIKWIIFALAIWAVTIVLLVGDFGLPVSLFAFVVPLISVAIAVAILRYRLWDIDILIRRTAIYGTLTVILALLYFAIVTLFQGMVSTVSREESPIAIVITTLIIAALFNPIRRKVQDLIDRRFYRRRYDTEQIMTGFALNTREEVDLDELADSLIRVVDETFQPEGVSLWLKG
ncbi:MAG: hypothetical protein R3335_11420 [Anaerolineales bacterium]|nr:hypothetical protein [Anaerolineales bacterium]